MLSVLGQYSSVRNYLNLLQGCAKSWSLTEWNLCVLDEGSNFVSSKLLIPVSPRLSSSGHPKTIAPSLECLLPKLKVSRAQYLAPITVKLPPHYVLQRISGNQLLDNSETPFSRMAGVFQKATVRTLKQGNHPTGHKFSLDSEALGSFFMLT